ncbi:hypothetical protein C8J57DRAFT_1237000 [Mycena rebaudengoi]|nr:hypothetical protein C8J57DRAFT_1237000 [Mycena rebaudengoi]
MPFCGSVSLTCRIQCSSTSLGNGDYIRAYILQAQKDIFPNGTSHKHLKDKQDKFLAPAECYIRYMKEIPALGSFPLKEEDDNLIDQGVAFRIAVCMSKDGSHRLLKSKYIQSDIAFRRIIGFKEFELGALEHNSRTSIVFCRVYLNRQTAAAHQIVFQAIHHIVFADTGKHLEWRHLHSTTIQGETGILHVTLDQHGGQAKGLGLYLKAHAQELVKFDLHEPAQLLSSLDEYDHLGRIMRLCTSHIFRNIKKAAVSDIVRNLMRSLVCMQHPDWDNTVRRIEVEGGTAGINWVADKIRSKFAFPEICWEKSFIPRRIWQTPTAKALLARWWEVLKKNWERTGIRQTYARGHISESSPRSLKRKAAEHHRALEKQDTCIETHTKRLRTAHNLKFRADTNLYLLEANGATQAAFIKAQKAAEWATDTYVKAVTESQETIGSGS